MPVTAPSLKLTSRVVAKMNIALLIHVMDTRPGEFRLNSARTCLVHTPSGIEFWAADGRRAAGIHTDGHVDRFSFWNRFRFRDALTRWTFRMGQHHQPRRSSRTDLDVASVLIANERFAQAFVEAPRYPTTLDGCRL
jgi:hypothetical protein